MSLISLNALGTVIITESTGGHSFGVSIAALSHSLDSLTGGGYTNAEKSYGDLNNDVVRGLDTVCVMNHDTLCCSAISSISSSNVICISMSCNVDIHKSRSAKAGCKDKNLLCK